MHGAQVKWLAQETAKTFARRGLAADQVAAGHEEDFYPGSDGEQLAGKLDTIHPGHQEIGDDHFIGLR